MTYVNNRLTFAATTNTYGRELYARNAPANVALTGSSVDENVAIGTQIGTLAATDADAGETITFSLPVSTSDNSAFAIVNNTLRTASPINYETKATYNLTVRATDSLGLYTDLAVNITVNNLAELGAPLKIGNGTSSRSVIRELVADFDADVVVDADAFLLQKRTTVSSSVVLETVATSVTLSTLPSGATRATLSFSGGQTYTGGALSDGYYQTDYLRRHVRLRSNNLAFDGNGDGTAGGDYVLGAQQADNFFALFGDTSGDGLVGVTEFGQFRTAFGKNSTNVGFNPLFDFDNDGVVGIADFGQFRNRFGKPALVF